MQKSAEHYTEAARDEIELLAAVAGRANASPSGAAACVKLLDSFDHRGPHGRHVCMVFEVPSASLPSPSPYETEGAAWLLHHPHTVGSRAVGRTPTFRLPHLSCLEQWDAHVRSIQNASAAHTGCSQRPASPPQPPVVLTILSRPIVPA